MTKVITYNRGMGGTRREEVVYTYGEVRNVVKFGNEKVWEKQENGRGMEEIESAKKRRTGQLHKRRIRLRGQATECGKVGKSFRV